MSEQKLQSQTVQTTGHAWDGDLQEYNNPLPVWWVYTFYATVIFSIVYWVIYPSWPIGKVAGTPGGRISGKLSTTPPGWRFGNALCVQRRT